MRASMAMLVMQAASAYMAEGQQQALLPANPATIRTIRPNDLATAWPCANSSSCEPTTLVSGSPNASTVLIFMHTGFDAGWLAFWHLLAKWDPKDLYLVAPDMPGDVTVPPVASPCTNSTAGAGLWGSADKPGPCESGFQKHVDYFHNTVKSFAGTGKKVVCVGHSLGGSWCQYYARKAFAPALSGMVLLSNPTDRLWAVMFVAGLKACVFKKFSDSIAMAKHYGMKGLGGQWGYKHPVLNQMLESWIGSKNFFGELDWYEQHFQSVIGKEFLQNKLIDPPVPHLMIYGANKDKTTYSWDGHPSSGVTKEGISIYCSSNPQCTYKVITLPDLSSQCEFKTKNATECLQDEMWGHWPHVDNPEAVRDTIAEWLKTAKLS
ncbi:hypothetical protein AB1Y20_021228 [Prymnesium parvum]|uniref:AB hydrolase-1 domain-containing protein n=1 Tax=Prymnesium parvum TaxID=97485 RepID=A0AB34JJ43_PRYPA